MQHMQLWMHGMQEQVVFTGVLGSGYQSNHIIRERHDRRRSQSSAKVGSPPAATLWLSSLLRGAVGGVLMLSLGRIRGKSVDPNALSEDMQDFLGKAQEKAKKAQEKAEKKVEHEKENAVLRERIDVLERALVERSKAAAAAELAAEKRIQDFVGGQETDGGSSPIRDPEEAALVQEQRQRAEAAASAAASAVANLQTSQLLRRPEVEAAERERLEAESAAAAAAASAAEMEIALARQEIDEVRTMAAREKAAVLEAAAAEKAAALEALKVRMQQERSEAGGIQTPSARHVLRICSHPARLRPSAHCCVARLTLATQRRLLLSGIRSQWCQRGRWRTRRRSCSRRWASCLRIEGVGAGRTFGRCRGGALAWARGRAATRRWARPCQVSCRVREKRATPAVFG